MSLQDVTGGKKEEHVIISLGGKEWELRYPVRAFRELQEQLGGWVKAWMLMANQGEGAKMPQEIDYEILAKMLVIGIHHPEADISKVSTWLNDLMQDEVAVIINAILRAKDRFSPEPKDKTKTILTHLATAKDLLVEARRTADAESLDALLSSLTQEVEDSQDDPQR